MMLNIQIIVVGKLKESYWREAETEYLKRLKPYTKLAITEIPEEPFHDHDDREKIKKKEAEKIIKCLPESGIIIVLDEGGKERTSAALATWLETESAHGDHITFIIGGPLGLHESIKKKANNVLSFSRFTFPHQMIRIFLLEQLYRASTIVHGKSYHY